MSWSIGETSALALKATRGAGLSWGLAEEAAGAVAWLHERNLPGVAALCSYLGAVAGHPSEDNPACPLLTGSAFSDGTITAPSGAGARIDLGRVLSPLLLLPFIASLPPGTMWLEAGPLGHDEDQSPDKWQSQWLVGEAPCHIIWGRSANQPGRRTSDTHAQPVRLLYREADAFRPPHLCAGNQRITPVRGRSRAH